MKKVIVIIILMLLGVVTFAQSNKTTQLVKYVTEAPDGSIAMTIYDDAGEDNMKLESVDNFYKYEILDPSTSETIYSSENVGKECVIDKTKIAAGTYNLRLYTSNFVITSEITIMPEKSIYTLFKPAKGIIASRE